MLSFARIVSAPAVAAACVLAAAPVLPLMAQDEQEPDKLYVFATAEGAGVIGGGAEEGYAEFSAEIDPKTGAFCYTLSTGDIDMTAAHVHKGRASETGAPVVTLEETDETVPTCVDIDPKLAKEIGSKPGNYYVNVHSEAFPAGALRGQLEE